MRHFLDKQVAIRKLEALNVKMPDGIHIDVTRWTLTNAAGRYGVEFLFKVTYTLGKEVETFQLLFGRDLEPSFRDEEWHPPLDLVGAGARWALQCAMRRIFSDTAAKVVDTLFGELDKDTTK